ncbi:MAG: peptidoglycan DD-metalloendopeptidase family protein [Alphaproteobacteria bacterium]|nr:peptidoglycan DD-metalloendopeptidase family protein [Alphaproteobacteria bacterium]
MRKLVLFLFLIAIGASVPARAATREKLRQIEQQLSQKKQQKEQLDATARATSKNLEALRGKLIDSARTLQKKQAEEEKLEGTLDDLSKQIAAKSKTAAQERKQLARIISALIGIAGRPPVTLFLQNGVTADHIHRSILLRSILPRLKQEAENTARDLTSLYDLKARMARQKRLVAAAQNNLSRQKHTLDQLISARQGFLKRTEAQKTEIAKHLAQLAAQATTLRELMDRVTPPRRGRREERPMPRGGLRLRWPVAGAVLRGYGQKDSDGVTSEGVTIAAPPGAPVVAPYAGKVVFEGPFRGYGIIMILQNPGGYHSFLSGFGRVDVDMGEEVERGEPLGTMPDGSGARPQLYFEWRRGDRPVDPGLR